MTTVWLALEAVAWFGAVSMVVPTATLFAQVLAACRITRPIVPGRPAVRPSIAVLMPAHDEASGIRPAIESVRAQLVPGDRLVVVADNCSDDTAAVSAALGAEVIQRHDTERRGKGYALDHGVRHIAASPRDQVIIVDADCIVHPGALDQLAVLCAMSGRPVQALYLMRAPTSAGLKTRIAEFAWLLRNEVRPMGCERLGWPCQLMGTGMAFPWSSISGASLASGHIVEDMQLGIDLALAGTPPAFCADALVTSEFPVDPEAIAAQRTRWEHGHFGTIGSSVPNMLWRALLHRRPSLAAMALDLAVPPLSSLALLLLMVVAGTLTVAVAGGNAGPLLLASSALVIFAMAVGVAWSRFGRGIVSASDWLAVPGYIVAKIPIYAKLYTARQKHWIRTRRGPP